MAGCWCCQGWGEVLRGPQMMMPTWQMGRYNSVLWETGSQGARAQNRREAGGQDNAQGEEGQHQGSL